MWSATAPENIASAFPRAKILMILRDPSDCAFSQFRHRLSFARQRPTQKEPVNVNAVLRQTIKLRSYDFASHGVQVTEEFDESLPSAVGDPQQLQQVFLNILNNAYDTVQESGHRGAILIRTRLAMPCGGVRSGSTRIENALVLLQTRCTHLRIEQALQ